MSEVADITVAYGDGIGPEIMDATLRILAEAKAKLNISTIEVGEAYYKKGVTTGIPPAAWDTLHRTKVLLKSPITTPQGGGYKSLNVTMRKTLGLYANIRPCRSYHPIVPSLQPGMDLVIIRENEEDLYCGVEYRLSPDGYNAIKVITRTGSERIIRYAFEHAQRNNRKKVTCMSKDNIMKMCDGTFHKVFDEVGEEYPDIEKEHYIIDIGAARIASRPEKFDVIVTENLYGDIISDIAAEVSGSVGMAGSANVGDDFAMFEAIHGSAPDIAGQNIANPSGLLSGAIMMLLHLGQHETAATIRNAWLKTLEDGMHTADIYGKESKEKLGTKEFAEAVVERLGEEPYRFKKARYAGKAPGKMQPRTSPVKPAVKTLVGLDINVEYINKDIEPLGQKFASLTGDEAELTIISSKGLKVWPDAEGSLIHTDYLRCRVETRSGPLPSTYPVELVKRLQENGFDLLKITYLFEFDGVKGYSLSAGE